MTARPSLALVVLACAAACGGPEPAPQQPGPGVVALGLFSLTAEGGDPAPEEIERLFGPTTAAQRTALLEALAALAGAHDPEVRQVEPLPGLDRVVVDLRAGLPGDGEALYSVQLAPRADGLTVVWFQGPGVEWPPAAPGGGSGLSVSAPPGTRPDPGVR